MDHESLNIRRINKFRVHLIWCSRAKPDHNLLIRLWVGLSGRIQIHGLANN